MLRGILWGLSCALAVAASAQDVMLVPLKKVSTGLTAPVERISFSSNERFLAASDNKNTLSCVDLENQNTIQQDEAAGRLIFHEFITRDNQLLAVRTQGELWTYTLPGFEKRKERKVFLPPVFVSLDPNEALLTVLQKNQEVELYDLKSQMGFSKIQPPSEIKNTLFMGYDRFGQQFTAINNVGDNFTWEVISQRLLRQLKLRSTEYSGSRSVVRAAVTSQNSENFAVAVQEVFIPKGGLQPNRQPERRNALLLYDWVSGQEKRRMEIRYRPDGMVMGPLPHVLFYFSKDSRAIFTANFEKGEVLDNLSVDESPSCIALSDNGKMVAVGTTVGSVYLYEIVRNNPSEIRITSPGLNRNTSEQTISSATIQLEGQLQSQQQADLLFVNDTKIPTRSDGSFAAPVALAPGKNRIRITAQVGRSLLQKDIYLTHTPLPQNNRPAPAAIHGKRIALVIGNANYETVGKLRNAINDANTMKNTLEALGFAVTVIENGTYESMKNAIYGLGDKIQDSDVSLFFYAGHGLEVDGINYLVPVDAQINSHLDVKQKCISLQGVLNTMEFANDEGLNMVILDACRNNPFPVGTRGGTGLARVYAPSGTLIAYATSPGSVASDGDGSNGLYTGELTKQLLTSQRIEDIFMNTRNAVEATSEGRQRPWEEARLKGVFYLK
ncbi:MAG: caspase family protein [Cyclobacteriaceae bacterium]|nr:caspase family protein [Cyclobacteriaceae bacterium]